MLSSQNNINISKQIKAYDIMCSGKNLFITGAGGTGKSFIIKRFVDTYKVSKKIAVTSTTGISALLIGGVTLHSYLGIGLGKGSIESMVAKIMKMSYLRNRWRELQVLIIDEISMLSPELFDKLEQIARSVRCSVRPFGGIQIIVSGDFCQLPCVESNDFCNEAKSWNECITNIIYLNEIVRQENIDFQNCLNHIRLGDLTQDVIDILDSRVGVELTNDIGIKPTKLCSHNYAVDSINEIELDKLSNDFLQYDMEIIILKDVRNKQSKIEMEEKFKKNCSAPSTLQLCIGAQVMLIFNLDIENKLVNGSRGIVTSFNNDLPVVKFLTGEERIINYHIWEIEEGEKKIMKYIQIPLKIAYALTIHKSQGASLDYAEIDLKNCFEYGQAYVALSRVRNIEGLSIVDYEPDKITAHPKAIEFYRNLDRNN